MVSAFVSAFVFGLVCSAQIYNVAIILSSKVCSNTQQLLCEKMLASMQPSRRGDDVPSLLRPGPTCCMEEYCKYYKMVIC